MARPTPDQPRPPRIVPPALPAQLIPHTADVGADEQLDGLLLSDVRVGPGLVDQLTVRECQVERPSLDDAELTGLHVVDSRLTGLDAAALEAPRSSWRSVHWSTSRVGAAELYESTWQSVELDGVKLGFVNARSARWRDVVLRRCAITELDLGGAQLERLAFEDCTVDTLTVGRARLTDVDLRGARIGDLHGLDGIAGAWIDQGQLDALAPRLAMHLGLRLAYG